MSTEDELAQRLIQSHRDGAESETVRIYPESHYNHYGNRGAADLYVATENYSGHLYELKSETAINEATGANEIIRQFNRMREFFFSGSSFNSPSDSMIFELCFTPSEKSIQHIAENADLYATVTDQEISGVKCERIRTNITIRSATSKNNYPIIMFSPNIDFRYNWETSEGFLDYVGNTQPGIMEEYSEMFREITDTAHN